MTGRFLFAFWDQLGFHCNRVLRSFLFKQDEDDGVIITEV